MQIIIKLFDLTNYTTVTQTCSSVITSNAWYELGLAVTIDLANDLSQITCTTNGVSATPLNLDNGYFQDLTTAFDISIGAQTDSPDYTDFYTGFLYSAKIWNKFNDLSNPSEEDGTDICTGSCAYCPLTGVCLDNC